MIEVPTSGKTQPQISTIRSPHRDFIITTTKKNTMKITLLTIITLMTVALGTLNAQHINIGTKIGLNSYTIDHNDNTNMDSRIGLHAGLIGHIHMSSQFAIQPELVYSMQGAKRGNTSFNLDYINIPVLLQYMFDNGFRIQAGPQLGFLINAEAKNKDLSLNIKDDFNTVDLGLSVGVSYIHPPSSFGVDFRYNLGLSDISKNSNVKSINRGLQIGILYLFDHSN